MTYQSTINALEKTINGQGSPWNAIDAESAARMKLQNRFNTGLDIAQIHCNDHARRYGSI